MLFTASFDVVFSKDDARTEVLVASNDDIFVIVSKVSDEVPTSLGQVPS